MCVLFEYMCFKKQTNKKLPAGLNTLNVMPLVPRGHEMFLEGSQIVRLSQSDKL